MSMQFIFDDDWIDVPCSHHGVISLESRPLNFRVIIIHVYQTCHHGRISDRC